MSRDFLASQAGRVFRQSPGRDRITRGSIGGYASIRIQKSFGCFLPFISDNRSQTGSFHYKARSTRELLFAPHVGEQWVEEVTWNPITNTRSVITISKDPNWVEPADSGPGKPPRVGGVNVSETRRVFTTPLEQQTIDLIGPGGSWGNLVDLAEESLATFQDFEVSTDPNSMGFKNYTVGVGNAVSGGALTSINKIAPAMPFVRGFGSEQTTFSATEFSQRVILISASVTANKVRIPADPNFIWKLSVDTSGFVSEWPSANSLEEIECSRPPVPNPTHIYEPDWDAARSLNMTRMVWTIPFPPVQWNQQVETFPGVFENQGPSAFGYPVPTCYPDIA